jgi:hypothetical protein
MRREGGSGALAFAAAALPFLTPIPQSRKPEGGMMPESALSTTRRGAEIDKLLERLETSPPPASGSSRLIFALDATASRQPTWDRACMTQGAMFEAVVGLGGLDVQLTYYRGFNECRSSRWVNSAADLHRLMRTVSCVGGNTQIERLLSHTITETKRQKVSALLFVGDAMEEKVDRLCHLAGELGSLNTPVFVFQEGNLPEAEAAFKQIAGLSGGAHLTFGLTAIDRLKELLGAVAAYAAGGLKALESYSAGKTGKVLRLTSRLRR